MRPVVHIVGARPNFIKMAPVIEALANAMPGSRQIIIHTGQHYDPEMSEIFFDQLGMLPPDYELEVGSGGHGVQTARALERLEPILISESPQAVVLGGDTNSTLSGALAAAKLEIPVAHVEAGLRSFDRSMPEEINRVLTDQVSHWCFTHSPEAQQNLVREGVTPDRVHLVGNTMIDTLVRLRERFERSDVHERLGLTHQSYLLVTLHRPSLVDGSLLEPTIAELERLTRAIPVVFPVHPRTRARLNGLGHNSGRDLVLIDPVGYLDFLALELHAAAVLTDSGGVQEETTFLGVPCFTLRSTTERPITLSSGTNRLLGLDPTTIGDIPNHLGAERSSATRPPLWDGFAARRLASILATDLQESP